MSQHWRQPGEHVPVGFFGPDNPAETGTRWARYPRGFALNDTTNNRLFDGAPPLNPFTNRPFLGAIIDQPRINNQTLRTGCVITIDVGDNHGGRAFRQCIVGPGSPIALALGQYSNVKVNVIQRSEADGTLMNQPVRIQWVDRLPSLPDAGLLRTRTINIAAMVETPVPDGAVQLICDTPGIVNFLDYAGSLGLAPDNFGQTVIAGQAIATLGQTFTHSQPNVNVKFLLAGL
jgi:hypothetical protein